VIAGETLRLMPERTVFWEQTQTLLLADPHLGKAGLFRRRGLPVPGGTTGDDLARVSQALERTGATRLIVLGDLLHGPSRGDPRLAGVCARWRSHWPDLRLELIAGNHDRRSGGPPASLRVERETERIVEPPFVLRHHPDPDPGGYVLAGHLHPAFRLRGLGGWRETLPAFWFGKSVGVLPAFGRFTGTATIRPRPEDRVFVLAETAVVGPLPASISR
jgi:DNA ligase-associated metallophosphoesterase